MARTIRDVKLETRAARARLTTSKKPYWKTLVPGRLHLGYRKKSKGRPGTWLARRYVGNERYRIVSLGFADDFEDTGANYENAQRLAHACRFAIEEHEVRVELTVASTIARYVAWLKLHRATGPGVEQRAALHILPQLGAFKVSELTTQQLNEWRDKLAASPALFRSCALTSGSRRMSCKPLNRARAVLAQTDAENGYLQRTDNTGRLLFTDDASVRDRFVVRQYLSNGRLNVFLEPIPGRIRSGDKLNFRIGLMDSSIPEPVYSEPMRVTVIDEEAHVPKKRKKKKKRGGKGDDKPGEGDRKPTRGLPPFKLLTRDGREVNGEETEQWPDDFSELDGGDVRNLGDGNSLYRINYDNAYHLKYRLKERGQVAKDVVTEKFILGMRIVMLGFEQALKYAKRKPDGDGITLDDVIDDMRQVLARAAASTVLALAENLPKIIDASAVDSDEVE